MPLHKDELNVRSQSGVFRHASFISTHNEALRQYCLRLGASPTKSSVIFTGVDLERFYPAAPRLDLQVQLGIKPRDRVLVFIGTIFRISGLFELLSELASALHENLALKFLILGDGEDFKRLKQLSNTLGLQNQVIMPGRIEQDSLADHIRLGHIALLPFRPEPVTHGALPNKVMQYLACGVPTVQHHSMGSCQWQALKAALLTLTRPTRCQSTQCDLCPNLQLSKA